ncbi:hypothetical protein [Vibrio lentus]|uniref:hypothetical protein n=1 Tax=Vibrio lentus TaxID=136468 RepID=UPI002479B566|nr:hypothetical protein [Vibrio lentus]WGS60571.1 hypothetical protein ISX51_15010 [Vibrio lentus]
MKSIWKVLGSIGVVIIIIIAGGIGKLVGNTSSEAYSESKKESELDSALMQAASQINQNLPMMVDAETRWDSTSGFQKQFRYSYTLVNYAAEDLDPKSIKTSMQSQLINSVCTTKEMQIFVNNGVPVIYAYYGKNGKQVTTITVHPSSCETN